MSIVFLDDEFEKLILPMRQPQFWSPGSSGTIPRLFMPELTGAPAQVSSGMSGPMECASGAGGL